MSLFTRLSSLNLSPMRTLFAIAGAGFLAQMHFSYSPNPKGCSMQWSGVGNHARYLQVVAVRNQDTLAQLPLGLLLF
jgi:hypothetical protein